MSLLNLGLLTVFLLLCQVFISCAISPDHLRLRGSGQYSGDNSGKYKPEVDKWAYKPDNRGKYVHVHIPYNGGYGPFQNPYDHDGRPYEHDDKKYIDPFDVQVYTDKTPSVYLKYGAPDFDSRY